MTGPSTAALTEAKAVQFKQFENGASAS